MQKVFFRNLTFLISLNLLIKPVWILGIDRTVQNVVGTATYGSYFVLFSLAIMTQIFLDVGISNYNNRYLAQNESELSLHVTNIFSIKLLLTTLYVAVTLVIGYLIGYSSYQIYLLSIICLNQALSSLIVFSRSNISALHHFKIDSILSVLDKALMIIICGTFLIVPSLQHHFNIEWFVYSQTISYLITLFAALGYLIFVNGNFRINLSIPFTRELLKKSLPFALLIFLMGMYSRMDAVMLEKLLPQTGAHEAGIYASAFRLLDALNQFGFLFAVLLLPIFSRMIGKKQNVATLVNASFTVIFVFSLIICLTLSFFSESIMGILYHDASPYSSKVLSTLSFSFLGTATAYIFGPLLTANGNLKELIAVSFIAVIVNFVLNLILIPTESSYGASIASSTTNMLIGFLFIIVSVKKFRFPPNYRLLIRLLIFTIANILLFSTQSLWAIPWMLLILLFGTIALSLAFLLKLFELKKIFPIVRQETV
ncbi:MAG: polysaccharide biosynthesis C-terminal domain-containing protein [Chitinophagales bacterium]|nr:polysaccharide biosynthesis C-terminal domain-containing protein [Chitinophagales bacterium]